MVKLKKMTFYVPCFQNRGNELTLLLLILLL